MRLNPLIYIAVGSLLLACVIVAFVTVNRAAKPEVIGVRLTDPEGVDLMKRVPLSSVEQIRAFGPAFPKVESGTQSGLFTDPETIYLIWHGVTTVTRARPPHKAPAQRKSGFEFTYRLTDGSKATAEYRFDHDDTHLDAVSLQVRLRDLEEREDLGLGEIIGKVGPTR